MSDEGGLPPHLDPIHQKRTGIEVLDHGLPALPDVLSYQMSVPVAFWKAASCSVVLFLKYSRATFPGDDAVTVEALVDAHVVPRASDARFSNSPHGAEPLCQVSVRS
jgi:hypothetical protein